jgi:hypothetical protein
LVDGEKVALWGSMEQVINGLFECTSIFQALGIRSLPNLSKISPLIQISFP